MYIFSCNSIPKFLKEMYHQYRHIMYTLGNMFEFASFLSLRSTGHKTDYLRAIIWYGCFSTFFTVVPLVVPLYIYISKTLSIALVPFSLFSFRTTLLCMFGIFTMSHMSLFPFFASKSFQFTNSLFCKFNLFY